MKRIFKIILDVIKIIITGWSITVLFCVAYQNGWIKGDLIQNKIAYDEFWEMYAVIMEVLIGFTIMFKIFLCIYGRESQAMDLSMIYRQKRKTKEKNSKAVVQQLEIRAAHEAGHVIMADFLGIKVVEATIFSYGNSGGHVNLDMGPILTSENLRKRVLILYGGLFAEKILLGSISNGCMGSEDSDLELASKFLKQYIILTDQEISLVGMECEKEAVNKRMIGLSKEWEEIVESALKNHVQKLGEEKERLLNDYYKMQET